MERLELKRLVESESREITDVVSNLKKTKESIAKLKEIEENLEEQKKNLFAQASAKPIREAREFIKEKICNRKFNVRKYDKKHIQELMNKLTKCSHETFDDRLKTLELIDEYKKYALPFPFVDRVFAVINVLSKQKDKFKLYSDQCNWYPRGYERNTFDYPDLLGELSGNFDSPSYEGYASQRVIKYGKENVLEQKLGVENDNNYKSKHVTDSGYCHIYFHDEERHLINKIIPWWWMHMSGYYFPSVVSLRLLDSWNYKITNFFEPRLAAVQLLPEYLIADKHNELFTEEDLENVHNVYKSFGCIGSLPCSNMLIGRKIDYTKVLDPEVIAHIILSEMKAY